MRVYTKKRCTKEYVTTGDTFLVVGELRVLGDLKLDGRSRVDAVKQSCKCSRF